MSIRHPSEWRSSPHTAYYNSFFLLRTAVTINGQPAEIGCSVDGEVTLSCHYPRVSVSLHSITVNLGAVLKKFGVSAVTHFYCERAPLFQVCFFSEYEIRKFLQARKTMQAELSSLLSATLSEQQRQTDPEIVEDVPTVAIADLFLVRPHVVQKEAQVVEVNVENYSECMDLWKESKVFEFSSLFRVYRMDPSKIPGQETVTLPDLLIQLEDVIDWFHLGLFLGVPHTQLLNIEHDYPRQPEERKTQMLIKWIQQQKPTWSALVRALVETKMYRLASKIALKYGVVFVPFTKAKGVHDLPFVAESVGSISAKLNTTIQQLNEEVEKNEQKLMRVAQTICHAQAEKTAASKKHDRKKRTLATVHFKTRKLIEEKRELESQLKMKKKELQFLQLLPEQQQENEDLKAIIAHKNVELMELQEKLQGVEKELQSAKEEAQSLREKLLQTTTELAVKSTRVQELERARSELRGDLESERKRVDQLLMQSASATSMKEFAKEIQLQLSHTQLEHQVKDRELAQHEETIAQKEKETQQLSEQVQALETQLQEVQDQHSQAPSTAELELEEQLQRLTVETSEVRVRLAEAEGEKEEAVRRVEAVLRRKDELLQLIAELETKRESPPTQYATVDERNIPPRQSKRSIPPQQSKRSIPPQQSKRSISPQQSKRSIPPQQSKRSISPQQSKRNIPPQQSRREHQPPPLPSRFSRLNGHEAFLNFISISDEEATAVANNVRVNKTLEILQLEWVNISDVGLSSLAAAIQDNQSLTHLDLQWTKISDSGANALATAIQNNKTLRILCECFLEASCMDLTVYTIKDRIGECNSVDFESMSDGGARDFAKKMEGWGSSLKTLRIYRTRNISEEVKKLLREIARRKEINLTYSLL